MSNIESSIRSYGGNGGLVTGSCHIYERGDNKIGIDYGKHQGKYEEMSENGRIRDLEHISEICRGTSDFLITHAHIDHIGLLPLVLKNGFSPNIYATEETFEFMKIMLQNSAEIQAKDKNQIPMYTMGDVDKTLRRIKKVEYFEEIGIGNRNSKIMAQFLPNGHINGSSSILVKDGSTKKNTLFTGDIGRPNQLLCGGYDEYSSKFPDCKIHTILTESTCFEKEPVSFNERVTNIFNATIETTQRGGVSVMPLIAGRMAPVMEIFHNAQEYEGKFLDYDFYMDAPLPRKVLKVHQDLGPNFMSNRYGDDPYFYKTRESSINRFDLKNLHIIESHEQSKLLVKELANSSKKAIVFASGGMCTRGRSVNYRSGEFNQNPNNSFILTCHQVSGTRGAEMINESKNKKEEGKTAEVIVADGNSSHATGYEIIDYLKKYNLNSLENFIPAHGQDSARKALAIAVQKEDFSQYTTISLPKIRQAVKC